MAGQPIRFLSWPTLKRRRPSKVQITALVLISLLCLGPIVALVSVIGRPSTPVTVISKGPDAPPDGVHVVAKVMSVSPTSGAVEMRITVQPSFSLVDEGGLSETLLLRVNDAEGENAILLRQGQPIRPIDVVIGLEGQSIERYPFDEYNFTLVFKVETVLDLGTVPEGDDAAIGPDAELQPIPTTIDLTTEANDFTVRVDTASEDLTTEVEAISVTFEVVRSLTTVLWSVGVMLLMWGLAIVGVMIVWAYTIWGIEFPMWSVGYYVGVLFSMPPLRESLPGSPPPGTLLDFVAFYWALGITVVTLMTMIGVWLQRARLDRKEMTERVGEERVIDHTGPVSVVEVDEPRPS